VTAEWKPASARESVKIGPSAEEMEKIKEAAKAGGAGAFPMMGSPFPMMPGMPPTFPGMGTPPPNSAPGQNPPKAMIVRTNDAAQGGPVMILPTEKKQ